MKRMLVLLTALVLLCGCLTACGEDVTEQSFPEETDTTTVFDEAIETFLSLYWQADPAAIDAAAPDALYTWLQSQGYDDKAAITAFVTAQQETIQTSHYGARIDSFTFTVAEHEQYNEENTATVKQTLSLNYGIEKSAVNAAYSVLLDSIGTDENGTLIPVDAISITVVDIGGTYYITEAFDLINDYAYQLWLK